MTLSPEFLAIIFGLSAAFTWGAGDFSGGIASKRSNITWVIIISQIFGNVLIALAIILFNEPVPPIKDFLIGAAAGIAGVLGMRAFLQGLAEERMGIIAPLTALLSSIVPTLTGFFLEGLPSITQIIGFPFAFLAVWLFSSQKGKVKVELKTLKYPLIAGAGYSLFLILIGLVSETSVFWPLVGTRVASMATMLIFARLNREKTLPSKNQLPIIALTGFLETGGNIFYALAARFGRLDISAVMTSLYSGVTVLLAWLILKEKLTSRQWLGVGAALTALVLISI